MNNDNTIQDEAIMLQDMIDTQKDLIAEHVKQISILKDNERLDDQIIQSQKDVIKGYVESFRKHETDMNVLRMKAEGLEQRLLTANWIIENRDWLLTRLWVVSGISIVGFGTTLYFLIKLINS